MSLKHLFAGIMGGGFALLLGVDPLTVAPNAVSPGLIVADKGTSKADEDKSPQRSARERDKDRGRETDKADKADKPPARETTWARRLVFPAGNKF